MRLPLGSLHWRTFWPALLLALCVCQSGLGDEESGWQRDATEDGVTVFLHEEPGRNLPIFRGVSTLDSGLYEILAVLDDTSRHTEWMKSCMTSKIIKQVNEFDRILYNRTDAPWPVSDRDVVLAATVEGSVAKREVWSRFQQVNSASAAVVDGVVRMPRLRGYYRLQALDEGHTRVTYQIDADPGGMLPDWLNKMSTRRLPVDTLAGLRRQTRKMRGRYDGFLSKYDPAHGGKVPDQFLK